MITAERNGIDQPSTLKPRVGISSEERFYWAHKTVLLVDDDRNTALFVRFGLKHMPFPPALQYTPNALEAVQYLLGQGQFANRELYPLPDLILLDLKMPLMDGFELLEWVRSQPPFRLLPVVILSGSIHKLDTERALQLGANAFMVKVGELLSFEQSLKETFARFLLPADPMPA
jgi:CheY-like chemotaxis protein